MLVLRRQTTGRSPKHCRAAFRPRSVALQPEPGPLFTFDAAGNLIKVKDAKLRETQFFYNSLNRLIKIQDALQQETLMEYDFTGRLTRLTDPLSRETVFS